MKLNKGKKFQLQICLMIIALVLQSIVPIFSNNTFADGIENTAKNQEATSEKAEMDTDKPAGDEAQQTGDKTEPNEEANEEANKPQAPVKDEVNKDKEDSNPVDKGNTEVEKIDQDAQESQEEENQPEEELQKQTYALGSDLGNIFTFKSLKVNGVEASQNQVVTIADGTDVSLDYTWSVSGANSGDYAEIDIPQAFIALGDFSTGKPIILSTGEDVGTYKIVGNKLRFDFNDGIIGPTVNGSVDNGTVGFAVKFNSESFNTDVVEEIKFNDTSDKTITIIGNPTTTVKSIAKSGTPDATQDAKKITWVVDVTNPSEVAILNAKVKDALPAGLEIDSLSVKVENLTIALNGDLNLGSPATGFTKNISGNNLEVNLDKIDPYRGYRVTYTTTITDFGVASFTNAASLEAGSNVLPASATVDVTRSSSIEKDGRIKGENLEWDIDINKAGGTITDASVEDNLPTGTTVVPGTIKVLKLTKSGNTWTESPSSINPTGFPVSLGDLGPDDTYRIKFETSIDYSVINNGEYIKDNDFKNLAILKSEGSEVGTAEKTVKITRAAILRKEGSAKVDYTNKTLTWKVHVNEAKHPIKNAVITDILPKGLTIDASDIKVYDVNNNDALVTPNQITITPNPDGTTTVVIDLGDIDKYYRIEYTTQIIDFTINEFKNGVSIGGTGVGTGVGTVGNPIVTPISPPNNSYSKTFTAIDYNEKTMDWLITANPTREAIKNLTITDTFPNNGLILIPSTLVVKIGSSVLTEGTHYTLAPKDGDYKNGFIIDFALTTNSTPINAAVSVTFKTSYDPEQGIIPNTSTDSKYKNNANFVGTTINNNTIAVDKIAEKQVIAESWNSGKKIGKLISIDNNNNVVDGWKSGNTRKIKWEVYTNFLAQNLGSNVTVTDAINYGGEVDTAGIEVREYIVAANGTTTLGNLVDPSTYIVLPNPDKKGFTLNFNSAVTKRYAIVFTTSVPDISQAAYTNTATVKVGNVDKIYTGSVSFASYNNNVSKKSLTTGNTVYTDDEVNWNIKINESLSTIQKDVKIVDTITKGLVYIQDSLKVYKLEGTTRILVSPSEYTLTDVVNPDGTTVLTLIFKDSISSTYEIDYTTVVTATTGTVNNKVEYSGANLEIKSVETSKLNAKQSSYATGDPTKGAIRVTKTDNEGNKITTSEAKFELWYKLNGEDKRFGDKEFETINGELTILNLPLNRTYYLKEVSAPEGYIGITESIAIEVKNEAGATGSGTYQQEVKNQRIKRDIEFIKKGEDLDANGLKGAKFTLYKQSDVNFENPLQTAISGDDGLVKFNDVEFGKYVIKETEAPAGYLPYEGIISVEINTQGNVTKTPSEIVDKKIRGNIEFQKVNKADKPLAGAVFGLYEKNNFDQLIITATSDVDGKVTLENIPYGKYSIKEITAPEGYAPSTKVVSVTIKDNGITVYPTKPIINETIVGDVEVIKFGESEDVTLKGAVFILEQDGVEKYRGKTDNQGRYVFKKVEFGTYTLKEIAAPEGYNLNSQTRQVMVSEYNQNIITEKFVNTKIRGSIKLKKLGEGEKALKDAEFSIFKRDDIGFVNPIQTVTSDENGLVEFNEVEFGKYNIKETMAPEGYLPLNKVLKVEIKTQGQVIDLGNVNNEIIKGNIEFTKKDNEENALADTEFTLYREADIAFTNPVQTQTSNKKGLVTFKDVEYGKYVIKETKTPIGYIASSELIKVEVKEDGKMITLPEVINTRIRGNVELIKTDNETNLLAGAKFGIYSKSDNKLVQEQTSGEDGVVRFTRIAYGEYLVREISAPEGYIASNEAIEVKVVENGQTINLENVVNIRIRGSIELTKNDNEGNKLEGATFGIYNKSDVNFENSVQTITSDKDGLVKFVGIPYGKYVIREISAPSGYLVSTKTLKAEIKDNGQEITLTEVFNKRIRASVKLTKTDNEGNNLSGATFGIYNESDENFENPIDTQESNKKGLVRFDKIPVGKYLLKEISAPTGYIASQEVITVEVTETDDEKVLTLSDVENIRIRANVELIKTDNEGNNLSGAKFGIYNKLDEKLVQEQISGEDGVVRFIGIPYGEYLVKEISAPTGYIASNEVISVKVTEQDHKQVIKLLNVVNTRVRASVELIKIDNEGKKLSGATFGIYNKSDDKLVQEQISDGNGVVRFDDIPVGEYLVRETKAPAGYLPSDKVISVKVTEQDHKQVLKLENVVNTRVRADIELIKKDNEGNKLSGATFAIYNKSDENLKKPVQIKTSYRNGIVRFSGIPVGEYLVKEIKAPVGYIISDKVILVKVTEEDHNQVIKLPYVINTRVRADIELIKKDNEGNRLSGATFAIYDKSAGRFTKPAQIQTSYRNGLVRFDAIPVGEYLVKEIKTPEGYIASDKVISVKVTEEDHNQVIKLHDVINTRVRADIELIKKDDEGKRLAGATFAIYDKSDKDCKKPVQIQTSHKKGLVVFEGIPVGKYLVKEIKAPRGYIASDKVISVKVTEEDHDQVIQLHDVINTRIRADIELIKTDKEGNKLAGAKFAIYNKSDKDCEKPVQIQTSDKKGLVVFEGITVGRYLIKEIEAPVGYIASDKVISVKVTEEDHNQVIELDDVINEKIMGSIEILKRDKSNHKPLKGAEIAVYTEDNVLVEQKITGEDGLVIFDDLEYGEYYYKEIKAPKGYVLDGSKHTFVIETDGIVLEETLDNTVKAIGPDNDEKPEKPEKPGTPDKPGKPGSTGSSNGKLPQTGQNSSVGIYLVAALLLAVGFVFRKRSNK